MFGKVLKNEIRHSARYNLTIYAVALAASVLMGLSLVIESSGIGVASCFALYIIGIITVVITLVSVIKNFYDTLFSRQGYLTLTLPVKGSTLLLSKVLVSFEPWQPVTVHKSRSTRKSEKIFFIPLYLLLKRLPLSYCGI